MQGRKVVITLSLENLQDIERIVLDGDSAKALAFVSQVVKPRVDDALNKGHCKPIFEWHRGVNTRVEPPPIKE